MFGGCGLSRTAILLSLLLVLVSFSIPYHAAPALADDHSYVPLVDKLVYKVLANEDQRVLALQAGETEMHFGYLDPVHLSALDADPDLEVAFSNRSGYHFVAFNCRRYPLNESALRRAFALAFDKERASTDIWDGFAVPYDSFLPDSSTWCVEDMLPYHYYTADAAAGNNLLESSGFNIDPLSGFRNGPDGKPFSVTIRCDLSLETHHDVALLSAEAFASLHISSSVVPLDFDPAFHNLHFVDPSTTFDLVVSEIDVQSERVDWIAHSFSSSAEYLTGVGLTGFSNATFDAHSEIVLNEPLEESYDDAVAMQMILHQSVPAMVVCQERCLEVYRNDWYDGQVPDELGRIHNRVTLTEMHRRDGTAGGIVPIGIDQAPASYSFNPFIGESELGRSLRQLIFPSMFKTGLTLAPEPYAALSVTTTTQSDNVSIPEGHVVYTINLATMRWRDKSPVCSLDFVYTLETLMNAPLLPTDLRWIADLVDASMIDSTRFRVELSTQSPWILLDLGFLPMVKNGTLDNKDIHSWDPFLTPDYTQNAGSFFFSDYEYGEFYEFSSFESQSYVVSYGNWDGHRVSPAIDSPDDLVEDLAQGVEWQILLGCVASSVPIVLVALFIDKKRGREVTSNLTLRVLAIALACSLLIVVPLGSFALSEPRGLSWGVSPGDTFQMEVCFRGFTGGQLTPSNFDFAQIEGLVIDVQVLELPSVNRGVLTTAAFDGLMMQTKVRLSCESTSPLIEDFLEFFEYYVSASLLPVGDWTAIGRVFDFSGHEADASSYFACQVDSIFLIGYHSFYIDAGSGWQANVSLTTGFPEVVQFWSSSYHPPYVYYSYAVALQLVQD